MPDTRFFPSPDTITLGELADLTGSELKGDADRQIFGAAPLQYASADELSFLENTKYVAVFETSQAGACFVREKFVDRAPEDMALLISDDPYRAYAIAAATLYPAVAAPEISLHAHIAETAEIGAGCSIGPGAVIGEGVKIGAKSRIGANAVISHAILGKRVIIHPNVNIGQDGFGFAMSAKGHLKVPQLGRVIIGDDVEIGAGSCIDRGAGPDTTIGDGTKIDNLVQIAHNVQIGRHAVIVSQVGISGSSEISDFAVLGGQVGVAGHLQIGPGAQVAAQSGVAGSLEGGKTYGGTPAVPIKDWHRQSITLQKLIKTKRREA